jgi:hypothetical protein
VGLALVDMYSEALLAAKDLLEAFQVSGLVWHTVTGMLTANVCWLVVMPPCQFRQLVCYIYIHLIAIHLMIIIPDLAGTNLCCYLPIVIRITINITAWQQHTGLVVICSNCIDSIHSSIAVFKSIAMVSEGTGRVCPHIMMTGSRFIMYSLHMISTEKYIRV